MVPVSSLHTERRERESEEEREMFYTYTGTCVYIFLIFKEVLKEIKFKVKTLLKRGLMSHIL